MKGTCSRKRIFSTLARLNIILVVVFLFYVHGAAQGGNSVSGHVFGVDRRPLGDVHVELLDDLSRTISRARTNSSGRYVFYGLSSGRFRIRVMPLATSYEEQEQDLEIVNFSRATGVGSSRTFGHQNEVLDFHLRPRRGETGLAAPSTVFAQEVPEKARELYKSALADLEAKKTKEAYGSLKASIEIFPKYFLALETLGVEYVRAGHFEAAQILLMVAVEVNPRAFKSHYGLARALHAQNKSEAALEAVEKAVALNANEPESLFLAGTLLRQAKKYSEAEKRLLKAKELFADSTPDIHWELALLYGNGMQRYKEAARELKLYLKANPESKNAENIKKLIIDFENKAKT